MLLYSIVCVISVARYSTQKPLQSSIRLITNTMLCLVCLMFSVVNTLLANFVRVKKYTKWQS